MSEARKKRRSFIIAVMMIVMAAALCMTLISCGDKNAAEEKENKVKTEQTVSDDKARSEDAEAQSVEKSDAKSGESAGTKDTQKATTEATTQTKKVCYITIEGYCSGKEISLQGGDTVYSILCRSGATVSGSGHYIQGINGRFEFDEGPASGWTYYVNGSKPSMDCGSCSVKAGDNIKWDYVTSY